MTAPRTIRAEAPLSDFSLSPSGSEMAGAFSDGRIRVWSIDGKPLRSWAPGNPPTPFLLYMGNRHILTGAPGSMTILDAASGARFASWQSPELVYAAAASDGSVVAGAASDGTVPLWRPDGTLMRTLAAPGLAEISRVAVSPGGERVAVCGTDADVRLFDGRTGAVEHVLDLTMTSFALDFSPDGRTLAIGGVDGSLALWDADSGRAKAALGSYPIPIGFVRFSPDGKRLASASVSNNPNTAQAEARVCDLASRKEASVPLGVSKWNAVGFAPGGRPFAVDIHAETISLWDLPEPNPPS